MWSSLGESRIQRRVLKVLGPSWTMEGQSKYLCCISKSLEGNTGDLDWSRIDPLRSKLFGLIQTYLNQSMINPRLIRDQTSNSQVAGFECFLHLDWSKVVETLYNGFIFKKPFLINGQCNLTIREGSNLMDMSHFNVIYKKMNSNEQCNGHEQSLNSLALVLGKL